MVLARRELLALGAVAVAAGVAGALFAAFGIESQNGASALLGEPFSDLDGRAVRLRDFKARALLCNFWATWCEPCREEVPLLVAARQQYAATGFEVVGIGVDQPANLREFAKAYRISYPIVVATDGTPALLGALGDRASALPFSVVLDQDRRIVHRKLGLWRRQELEKEIEAVIG
jgi:peroxiredoxin